MKARFLHIVLIIILASPGLSAQHLPKFSLWEMNQNSINPAAFVEPELTAKLFYRNQWTGFESAPVNAGINISKGFGGFYTGLVYHNDKAGIFQQNMVQVQYAYKLYLSRDIAMNMGIAGGINAYRINYQELNMYHADDPLIYSAEQSSILPDFNLGIMITNKIPQRSYGSSSTKTHGFQAGISVQHLTSAIVTNESIRDNSYLLRHFNFSGSFRHELNRDIDMEESLLAKYVTGVPVQAEIAVRGIYQNTYWLGLSWRSVSDIILKTGIEMNGILFGYAWDLGLSKIPNHSSHEIVLGYRFGSGGSVPKY